MSDLVERLRVPHYLSDNAKAQLTLEAEDILTTYRAERREAASTIQSLEAENSRLKEALTKINELEPVPLAIPSDPYAEVSSDGSIIEAAAKVIDKHRPDASFDDSSSGYMERDALLKNLAAEVRALKNVAK